MDCTGRRLEAIPLFLIVKQSNVKSNGSVFYLKIFASREILVLDSGNAEDNRCKRLDNVHFLDFSMRNNRGDSLFILAAIVTKGILSALIFKKSGDYRANAT